MESNGYNENTPMKVLTQKDLDRMVWRSLLLQASFNYERMQACGWLYGLIPGLKKVHTNKEDLSKSMSLHMEFFNTHPFLVTFIMGLVLAMEEGKEDRDTIRAIKIATMGPLGGIGDSLLWLTALPVTASIGIGMAKAGNPLGPIVFLILINIIHFALQFGLMNYGYQTGVSALSTLKDSMKQVSQGASIVGLMVVGALVAQFINVPVDPTIIVGTTPLPELLDSIMPKLLPLLYTWFIYSLMKKGTSPIWAIAVTIVIGIVGAYFRDILMLFGLSA